jgi:hypothetical protein
MKNLIKKILKVSEFDRTINTIMYAVVSEDENYIFDINIYTYNIEPILVSEVLKDKTLDRVCTPIIGYAQAFIENILPTRYIDEYKPKIITIEVNYMKYDTKHGEDFFDKLNESEDDDLDWIRDIQPREIVSDISKLSVGDRVILSDSDLIADSGDLPPKYDLGEIVTVNHIDKGTKSVVIMIDIGSNSMGWGCSNESGSYYNGPSGRLCWWSGLPVIKVKS